MHSQSTIDVGPSQSMSVTGKGPGQDAVLNPYAGSNSIAIVKNAGKNPFTIRIHKSDKERELISVDAGEVKEILLIPGYELYLDSNQKTKAKIEFKPASTSNKVVLASAIEWEQLNPARGDQSPQAGTIWGDRKGEVATGFLVKFVDGFSSPPHIHNVTYRGMVISGLVHNDDPDAEVMWMPPGSFWTQPAGEVHITSAKGEENVAYIEIDSGPYLVKPVDEAFDDGERPVNVHRNNIVWLNAEQIGLIPADLNPSPEISFLWGSLEAGALNGSLIKIPANFQGTINSLGDIFHAVVIQGAVAYGDADDSKAQTLTPGSYFNSTAPASHQISSSAPSESLIYIRTNGKFSLAPNE